MYRHPRSTTLIVLIGLTVLCGPGLLLTGCSSSASTASSRPASPAPAKPAKPAESAKPAPLSLERVQNIKQGQTTKTEVVQLLGEPDTILHDSTLEEWWYTPKAEEQRSASGGVAQSVGRSAALGGVGALLGYLIPGGSTVGSAVAAGMARSGIMAAGTQAVRMGTAGSGKPGGAPGTLVIHFEGDVVHDYTYSR